MSAFSALRVLPLQIRVFTVGQGTTSYTPLTNLDSIAQPWTVANASSIGVGNWTEFSAVCWFTGRDLYNALGGTVPIGLIRCESVRAWGWGSMLTGARTTPLANGVPFPRVLACSNNWGGTRVEAWSSPDALKVCNASSTTTSSLRSRHAASSVNDVDEETRTAPYAFASPSFASTGGPGPNNASVLWNAMIVPYTVGPMAIKGFTW